jgi:hypothetical protein
MGGGYYLYKTYFEIHYFPFFPYLVALFFVINLGFCISFFRSYQKGGAGFIRAFMLLSGIKIMAYFLLVLVYFLVSSETAKDFILALAVLYIAYTFYDVYLMISLVRREKENPDPSK